MCMTAAVMLLTGCSNTQKADDSSGETIDAMAEPDLDDLNIELGKLQGNPGDCAGDCRYY